MRKDISRGPSLALGLPLLSPLLLLNPIVDSIIAVSTLGSGSLTGLTGSTGLGTLVPLAAGVAGTAAGFLAPAMAAIAAPLAAVFAAVPAGVLGFPALLSGLI